MNFSIFKTVFSYALRDVSRNRLVFALTIVSLSIIFTAVLLTGGILEGFGTSLSKTQTDVIGELVIVPSGNDLEIVNASKIEMELAKIENVQSFSSRRSGAALLEYGNKKIGPYLLTGIDVKKEKNVSILNEKISEGRFLSENDSKKIVLGATIADALVDLEYDEKRVSVGSRVMLTSLSGNKWEYEVIGIVDAKTFYTNWATLMADDEWRSFSNANNVDLIVIKLKDPKKIIETLDEIKEKITFAEVQTWKEQAGFIYDIILVFGFITVGIIILLSISVFMITSVILYINFLQYRRQIGILKSMGVSNYFIIWVYMTEAFIFATLSFGVAFFIFYFINLNSNQNPIPLLIGDFHTSLEFGNIMITFIILLVSSIGGSVVPAYIATKINIIDIIRDA